MRFGGIWIQRGQRLIRSQERSQADDEFAADFERLYKLGHRVLLVPGKNYGKDELFVFETAADALDVYDGDLSDFECFLGNECVPCGFEDISLYRDGCRVASKSCAPSTTIEVSHEPTDMKVHRTGRRIVQQDISEE